MWERFQLRVKICRLSNMIITIENDIMTYRTDMKIINELYYAGRGNVEEFTEKWCNEAYWKIAACHRLKEILEKRLKFVVGKIPGKNF